MLLNTSFNVGGELIVENVFRCLDGYGHRDARRGKLNAGARLLPQFSWSRSSVFASAFIKLALVARDLPQRIALYAILDEVSASWLGQ